ncbi:MAG: hypothetical protein Q7R60_04470, partial [bacterium]|nr:hypothetical protein [bacterium]
MKGIVIEDYKDRILFSTADGEIAIMKSDIRQLYFDSEEDNLIKLAEQAKERKDFTSAFAYYDMALRANPNSKTAKDGLIFLQGYLFRKEQAKKEEEIRRREDFEEQGKVSVKEAVSKGWEELEKELRSIMGITIEEARGPFPEITDVLIGSPAYEAGMRKGDFMAARWSKLTGYMSVRDVIDMLLEKPSPEIKCTIQRTLDILPDR